MIRSCCGVCMYVYIDHDECIQPKYLAINIIIKRRIVDELSSSTDLVIYWNKYLQIDCLYLIR